MPLVPPSQPMPCYAIGVASMVGDWAKNYARPASLIEAIYMCVLSPSEPLPGHYVGRHRAMKRPFVGVVVNRHREVDYVHFRPKLYA